MRRKRRRSPHLSSSSSMFCFGKCAADDAHSHIHEDSKAYNTPFCRELILCHTFNKMGILVAVVESITSSDSNPNCYLVTLFP
jgi:hypothetical protein